MKIETYFIIAISFQLYSRIINYIKNFMNIRYSQEIHTLLIRYIRFLLNLGYGQGVQKLVEGHIKNIRSIYNFFLKNMENKYFFERPKSKAFIYDI